MCFSSQCQPGFGHYLPCSKRIPKFSLGAQLYKHELVIKLLVLVERQTVQDTIEATKTQFLTGQ